MIAAVEVNEYWPLPVSQSVCEGSGNKGSDIFMDADSSPGGSFSPLCPLIRIKTISELVVVDFCFGASLFLSVVVEFLFVLVGTG